MSVDENLQCTPLPTTDDIVASVTQQSSATIESVGYTGDQLPAVTYQEASSAFLKIQSFLLRSDESDEHSQLLNKLEHEIHKRGNSASVQSAITNFFTIAS